jgi:hypothetical protein
VPLPAPRQYQLLASPLPLPLPPPPLPPEHGGYLLVYHHGLYFNLNLHLHHLLHCKGNLTDLRRILHLSLAKGNPKLIYKSK